MDSQALEIGGDSEELARICNGADRTCLAGRMPFPYEKKDAPTWLGMALAAAAASLDRSKKAGAGPQSDPNWRSIRTVLW